MAVLIRLQLTFCRNLPAMYALDSSHAADLRSWVPGADDPATDFPPQNLPFCRFQGPEGASIGVGIGDRILDLAELARAGLLDDEAASAIVATDDLRGILQLELAARLRLRHRLVELVTVTDSALGRDQSLQQAALLPRAGTPLLMPVAVGNYTDFYASLHHARNVGSMMRPDNPLLPNYKHIPIGYHGRASSLVVSGTAVRRPVGQTTPASEGAAPGFGPCRMLDHELEIGMLVGRGNRLGEPIPIHAAEQHMFGIVLLNDWSARDLQRWEYQPLGPFLAKSFATSISPWVVTLEALAPFRSPATVRAAQDPVPLPYLQDSGNQNHGGIDLTLEVLIRTPAMRQSGSSAQTISRGNFRDMYWTLAQMLTHHASNGCNLCPGDLLGSGTVSGPERSSRGCLLELTWDGDAENPVPGTQRTPLKLHSGEERTFLLDGDELILRGWCERTGFRRIGLGECSGTILPAPALSP